MPEAAAKGPRPGETGNPQFRFPPPRAGEVPSTNAIRARRRGACADQIEESALSGRSALARRPNKQLPRQPIQRLRIQAPIAPIIRHDQSPVWIVARIDAVAVLLVQRLLRLEAPAI